MGGIFIGALQDYASGMISIQMGGLSFPEIVRRYLVLTVKQMMRGLTLALMVLVGAVFWVGACRNFTRNDRHKSNSMDLDNFDILYLSNSTAYR